MLCCSIIFVVLLQLEYFSTFMINIFLLKSLYLLSIIIYLYLYIATTVYPRYFPDDFFNGGMRSMTPALRMMLP